MTIRSAPSGGYDFGKKRQYRRGVWRAFSEMMRDRRAQAVCVLMPSSEGAEIELALAHGFREENLIFVDRNPAVVAVLKRKYRKARAIGLSIGRAAERIDPNTVDVCNFDFCGPIGSALAQEVAPWIQRGLFRDFSAIAITVLRGREQEGARAYLERGRRVRGLAENPNRITPDHALAIERPSDAGRLLWMSDALSNTTCAQPETEMDLIRLPYRPFHNFGGHYVSTSGQGMLWSVFRLHRNPCPCDDCIAAICLECRQPYSNRVALEILSAMAIAYQTDVFTLFSDASRSGLVLTSAQAQLSNFLGLAAFVERANATPPDAR